MTDVSVELEKIRATSTCLKRQTACLIIKNGKIIAKSANKCSPPNGICKRLNTQTGTKYGLCDSKHAEALCSKQMKKRHLHGGEAHLLGHYYACEDCKDELKSVGVESIRLYEG